jgi:oligoribonuclease NrnB/cAMP/cGMP phosphodiesterase (DHH superfamily)
MYTHVISHRDIDGIVCAVLLKRVFPSVKRVTWTQPWSIGGMKVDKDTIISDLPYRRNCGLWFDHHRQNAIEYTGVYDPKAKSCARIIYNKYEDKLKQFKELVKNTDKIDSGGITLKDIKHPTPLGKLSMCLTADRNYKDMIFADWLFEALGRYTPEQIIKTDYVKERLKRKRDMIKRILKSIKPKIIKQNKTSIIVIDEKENIPKSVIYNIYAKHLKAAVSIKMYNPQEGKVRFEINNNIFNNTLKDKIKEMRGDINASCKEYNGGGHKYNTGGMEVSIENKEKVLKEIIERIGGKKDGERGKRDTGRDHSKAV